MPKKQAQAAGGTAGDISTAQPAAGGANAAASTRKLVMQTSAVVVAVLIAAWMGFVSQQFAMVSVSTAIPGKALGFALDACHRSERCRTGLIRQHPVALAHHLIFIKTLGVLALMRSG